MTGMSEWDKLWKNTEVIHDDCWLKTVRAVGDKMQKENKQLKSEGESHVSNLTMVFREKTELEEENKQLHDSITQLEIEKTSLILENQSLKAENRSSVPISLPVNMRLDPEGDQSCSNCMYWVSEMGCMDSRCRKTDRELELEQKLEAIRKWGDDWIYQIDDSATARDKFEKVLSGSNDSEETKNAE